MSSVFGIEGRERVLHVTKVLLARARWFDKSYQAMPKDDYLMRKCRSKLAIDAYAQAFKGLQALMVDARRDKAWMDAYLAKLKPMTLEAARANYIWWCSRERGERSEEVLKWADTALDVYRRGVRFVLDEYEKVFEERLE